MPDVRANATENVSLYDEAGVEIGSQQLQRLNDTLARLDTLLQRIPPEVSEDGDRINNGVARYQAQLNEIELLNAISSKMFARLEGIPQGVNHIGYINPDAVRRVQQGRFFLTSTGRLSLGVPGGNLRFTFTNPAGSGVSCAMARIAGFSSAGAGFASIMLNPTEMPTTTPRPTMNAVAGGGLVAKAEVRADLSSTAMSGGIDTGIVIGIPQNSRFSIDLPPIIVVPGMTVGVNVPYTATGDVTFSAYWTET